MFKRSLIIGAALAASVMSSFAADNLPAPVTKAAPAVACQSSQDCSGGYATFGLGLDAALGSTLTGGSNNGNSINFGGGYQVWKGALIAGIEVTGGYQFGTQGSTGTATSTQFVKLGYNFFPAGGAAAPAPSQNPFLNLVPSNLLANSTPAIIAGGAYGHGVEKAAVGLEVDTVVAAGWSTAFQWYNAPSVKGQSDENVFRIMVQKHF
jgi:opacity protein-like surface antigen